MTYGLLFERLQHLEASRISHESATKKDDAVRHLERLRTYITLGRVKAFEEGCPPHKLRGEIPNDGFLDRVRADQATIIAGNS